MYHRTSQVSLHLQKAYDTIYNFVSIADPRALDLPKSRFLKSDKYCLDILNATYLKLIETIKDEQENIKYFRDSVHVDDEQIVNCTKQINGKVGKLESYLETLEEKLSKIRQIAKEAKDREINSAQLVVYNDSGELRDLREKVKLEEESTASI